MSDHTVGRSCVYTLSAKNLPAFSNFAYFLPAVKFTFTVLIARTQTQSNFYLQDSKFRVDDSAN
jgi:hypothetical protein